jgi:hypothetical protein
LECFTKAGVRNVRLVNRAKVILALDTSGGRCAEKQEDIANRLDISRQAVNNARNDYLEIKNVSKFLQRKKRETPPIPPKITGEVEARIIALACSEVPQGYARWTLKLLAEKSVELHYIDTISRMSICSLLKKQNSSLI